MFAHLSRVYSETLTPNQNRTPAIPLHRKVGAPVSPARRIESKVPPTNSSDRCGFLSGCRMPEFFPNSESVCFYKALPTPPGYGSKSKYSRPSQRVASTTPPSPVVPSGRGHSSARRAPTTPARGKVPAAASLVVSSLLNTAPFACANVLAAISPAPESPRNAQPPHLW